MKWILAQLNRPFLRESHTFLIKGFFEWKFAHFTRTWIARWIFTHFCSHHEAHGITKGLPACFFKMDTTSQLIGGSFALRSSLLLSHSHQEDTFEKNLLHFMPCYAIIAGLGDTFRACGEERSQMNRGWTQFGDARQIENGPRRLESISQRWRHTCNGCCATHARSRAVVSSFVGLFGVSMNHRRKMTFIAGSKSALGWLVDKFVR